MRQLLDIKSIKLNMVKNHKNPAKASTSNKKAYCSLASAAYPIPSKKSLISYNPFYVGFRAVQERVTL